MLVVLHETQINKTHRRPNNQEHYSRKEECSIETRNSQGEFKCGDYIFVPQQRIQHEAKVNP
jgi:hypothetical protein